MRDDEARLPNLPLASREVLAFGLKCTRRTLPLRVANDHAEY